jgi:hypothetical protein
MKIRHDWIRLKYDVNPNQMICERCGKMFEMPIGGISFNMMLGIMGGFAKDHIHCKVKAEVKRL